MPIKFVTPEEALAQLKIRLAQFNERKFLSFDDLDDREFIHDTLLALRFAAPLIEKLELPPVRYGETPPAPFNPGPEANAVIATINDVVPHTTFEPSPKKLHWKTRQKMERDAAAKAGVASA